MFDRAEHMTARVHGSQNAAGNAMQAGIEFLLEAAEAVVVDADVAEYLGGDLVVWIEALKFFLEVNALEVEGADARSHFGLDAAGDPGKAVAIVKALGDLLLGCLPVGRVDVCQAGEGARVGGFVLVVNFSGDRIDGVHLHGHGELAHVAVVEDTAARRYFKCALLLLLRAFDIV